ncbi:hypothetical protein FQN57_000543 [Myotisia sp. PD_48]|nr:hypothetical protein FQN57_000543 [Myotisia sp. PD_48]
MYQTNPRQLTLNILDELAQNDPERLYAELPISPTSYESGFRKVTYRTLANAVNNVAWCLTESLGAAKNFETLAYIGPNDLGHNLLLLGAAKAGYKMLLIVPQYTTEAQVRLMKSVDCNTLLIPAAGSNPATDGIIKQHGDVRQLPIPTVDWLLTNQSRPFPYTKTYEEAKSDPFVVLHTSGSTGFPKPVVWTNEWVSTWVQQRYLELPEGFESLEKFAFGIRLALGTYPAHGFHMFVTILSAFFLDTKSIFPPAGVPLSASTGVEASKYTKVEAIAMGPKQIEELASRPDLIDTLIEQKVESIFFGGACISDTVGNYLASRLKVFNGFGSTETGMWPVMRKAGPWDPMQWKYLCFNPRGGIEFRQEGDEYRGILVNSKDPEEGSPVFHIFPDQKEFDSGDLFTKATEPGKEHLWAVSGRSDDLQVYANAGKLNPVVAEQRIINSMPGVITAALIVGTGLDNTVVLIELAQSATASKGEVLEHLEPVITEINKMVPVYAKLDSRRVVFLDAENPMSRTAKGNVQRKKTVGNYWIQIQQVHNQI